LLKIPQNQSIAADKKKQGSLDISALDISLCLLYNTAVVDRDGVMRNMEVSTCNE